MATAAESARSRDAAEGRAETVYAAAVALVAAQMVAGQEPSPDLDPTSPLMRASAALALALMRSTPSRYGGSIPSPVVSRAIEEHAADLADDIAKEAVRYAQEHWKTISERVRRSNPDASVEDIAVAYTADTPWQRAVARTTATRQAAETALSMVEDVNREVGEEHRVVWISRGDTKVRRSHRKLHGKHRKPGSSFKSWPSGQKLSFPGDPRAPLDETINCRCALILVPVSTAHMVPDTLRVSDADFDLVASARPGPSQAELDLLAESVEIFAAT